MNPQATHSSSRTVVVSGVIPVRMRSQRLPGKPLMLIRGRPMIGWVYHRTRASHRLNRLTVATDSSEVLAFCAGESIPVVWTSAEHRSGTSRLIEVMDQDRSRGEVADLYVNIQGDEPMVTSAHIDLLLEPFFTSAGQHAQVNKELQARAGFEHAEHRLMFPQVSTLKVAITHGEAANPNAVKVVTDAHNRALYFSRALIPYDRDTIGLAHYFKHLGFYAYTTDALDQFRSLIPSPLEQAEQLEQLRFLENGIPITVVETTDDTIGVDTEEDLRSVEEYFRKVEP